MSSYQNERSSTTSSNEEPTAVPSSPPLAGISFPNSIPGYADIHNAFPRIWAWQNSNNVLTLYQPCGNSTFPCFSLNFEDAVFHCNKFSNCTSLICGTMIPVKNTFSCYNFNETLEIGYPEFYDCLEEPPVTYVKVGRNFSMYRIPKIATSEGLVPNHESNFPQFITDEDGPKDHSKIPIIVSGLILFIGVFSMIGIIVWRRKRDAIMNSAIWKRMQLENIPLPLYERHPGRLPHDPPAYDESQTPPQPIAGPSSPAIPIVDEDRTIETAPEYDLNLDHGLPPRIGQSSQPSQPVVMLPPPEV
ncbi:hypothetical protein HDU97_004097 [Phlyctochytrium planicorne]|nr:hypothetical protein HDU97_004097 [Phlyctochytrium planicorne]